MNKLADKSILDLIVTSVKSFPEQKRVKKGIKAIDAKHTEEDSSILIDDNQEAVALDIASLPHYAEAESTNISGWAWTSDATPPSKEERTASTTTANISDWAWTSGGTTSTAEATTATTATTTGISGWAWAGGALAAIGIGAAAAGGGGGGGSSAPSATDTTAPVKPTINTVAGNDVISGAEKTAGVIVTGTAEVGSTVTVVWGATTKIAIATNGTYSVPFSSSEIPTDSAVNITATARDSSNNTSIVATHSVTIDTLLAGYLIDSAVNGVDYYINGVKAGITDTNGKFMYHAGDTITFKVGNVTIGDVKSTEINTDSKVLLQDLVGVSRTNITDSTVVKIAQFLQTLDNDGNASYGITVDTTKLAINASGDLLTATINSSLFAANVTVVTADAALTHLGANVGVATPVVSEVKIVSTAGIQNSTLNTGDVVSVKVTMSEIVSVSGIPQLALHIGSTTVQANYVSGSGSKDLIFNYTILSGQTDANGISVDTNSLTLNSGTINDVFNNSATLAHLGVVDNASYKVDTTAPIISTNTIATAINENTGAGQTIYTATATDSGTIAYTLRSGSDTGLAINAITGAVTLTANPNYETKSSYNFTVVATDTAGNASEKAVALVINNVNEAPFSSDTNITIPQGTDKLLTLSDFVFSDMDIGNTLSKVIITSLPVAGILTYGGVAVVAGQEINAADISSGKLVFTPSGNDTVTNYASFGFKVSDGVTYSTTINFVTFNIGVANTAPTFILSNGTVTTDIGVNTNDQGYSVRIQKDGKILVAGSSDNDFALVRYNSNGSPDTTFGTDGKVTTDIGINTNDQGYSVTVQKDNKILVSGNSGSDLVLVRYNSDGSLDTTFDGDGKVIHTNTNTYADADQGHSVAVQSDGRILVTGSRNWSMGLFCYNSDGSLDWEAGNGSADKGYGVTVQTDGKILEAGANGSDFVLLRYNTDGSFDNTFALIQHDEDGYFFYSYGVVKTDIGTNTSDYAHGVTIQADGKILVAGYVHTYSSINSSDFALVRYNSDGSLDTSFDGDGKVRTHFNVNGYDFSYAYSVIVQADGKILVAGNSGFVFVLVRYNSDGSLDTSFDGDGKVMTNIRIDSADYAHSVTVQEDGKIVVAGDIYNYSTNNYDFALVRYNIDGSLDATFLPQQNTLAGNPIYAKNSNSVILALNAQIIDAELSALGNYNGASLTLVRHGGANIQDIFSASGGQLSTLESGCYFSVDRIIIGSVAINDSGTLTLIFNANATELLVDKAIQHIAYANTSDAPPASVQIDWTFSDGNTSSQGTGGTLSVTGSTIVQITTGTDVDKVGPDIAYLVFSSNAMQLVFDEIVTNETFTGHTMLQLGTGSTLSAISGDGAITLIDTGFGAGSGMNIDTGAVAPTQYVLMSRDSGFTGSIGISDASGNVGEMFQGNGGGLLTGVAIGNTATASIDLHLLTGDCDIVNVLSTVNSTLVGNSGNSWIEGGSGNDTIIGGTGADEVLGGGGSDTFIFAQGDSTAVTFNDYITGIMVDEGSTVTPLYDFGIDELSQNDSYLFTGGYDLINMWLSDVPIGSSVHIQLDSGMTQDTTPQIDVGNQQFELIGGNFDRDSGVFIKGTYSSSSATLVIYDGDSTTGTSQTAIVLQGLSITDSHLSVVGNTINYVL